MGQWSGEFFQLTVRVKSRRIAQRAPASRPNPYIGAATSGSTAPYRMTPEKRASATEITVALAKMFLIRSESLTFWRRDWRGKTGQADTELISVTAAATWA